MPRNKHRLETLQRQLIEMRELCKNHVASLPQKESVFLSQIGTIDADIKRSQAIYDSLNALHTTEVDKLAKSEDDD